MSERKVPDTGVTVRVIEYNMEDFVRSCVERYKELTGVTVLSRAATPFLQEASDPDFTDTTATSRTTSSSEHALRESMKKSIADERDPPTMPSRQLKPYAAKVLMNILYAARYARLDL